MSLKAVLFNFNGVIIKDESIHQQLIDEILLAENLRPNPQEYWKVCLGKSDRACLQEILARRGRVVTEAELTKLMEKKAQAYVNQIEALPEIPIYPEIPEFLAKIQGLGLKIGLVSGAMKAEIELVCDRAQIKQYFNVIVAGDEIHQSKPDPYCYLFAIERFNRQEPTLQLKPANCLAIEDTPAGITAAKSAGMQVVGVANTYPFHMLQRQANWTVDYLSELELERVQQIYSGNATSVAPSEC
ncbi:HAD family hydrolase [Oscillatoria salina]|uniref:HAD family hydrolase n=1 Tax=Oscillatoria salina TaxID=331517 RepID=UPI001CCDEAD8|nr:HAD family phosphatase [Oscillatoria salina]MBZ8182126.1 HAD family phosphatase [Oscillatoria salina IIICB1]